ncbi:MAG TPA: transglutaminase-like domain-containing protein, partial [Pirellulales bacterium]
EPFKPKNKQQRAIALSTNNITESHERPARGDSAQREFSIARRSPPRPRPLRDLQAEALFSVQGRTPLHLPLKRYDHFDGLAWRECEALPNRFALKSLGGDWIGLPEPSGPYVAGTITHKIKLGRLRSRRVPLPHDATRFRLGAAGRPDFFYLGASGSLDLADPEGHVPAGEFLHTVETTIDRALCANLGADRKFSTPASNDSAETPSPLFGDYAPRQEVLSLASEWTKAVSPGWRQVEAVVSRLRSQYFHDRESVPPADHPDPLAWFLLESRRGPDYLFAGAAAVVLKAHGWPVRVVSGGYADPTKYDRAANYTHVGSDDLHFWLEVQLPDGLWLPLEPTPGFELAPHVRTWSQWLSDLAGSAVRRLWSNLAILCTGAVLLCGLYAGRRDVTALFALIRWRVLSRRSSANLVDETLRLIETRQWLAEMNRPRGCTPRRFFRERVASVEREETLDPDAVEALLQKFDLHDHATFGSLDGFSRDAIGGVCRRAVAQWPWRKFLPPLVRSTEPVVVKRETADLAV